MPPPFPFVFGAHQVHFFFSRFLKPWARPALKYAMMLLSLRKLAPQGDSKVTNHLTNKAGPFPAWKQSVNSPPAAALTPVLGFATILTSTVSVRKPLCIFRPLWSEWRHKEALSKAGGKTPGCLLGAQSKHIIWGSCCNSDSG